MITMLDIKVDNAIAYNISGKITDDEITKLFSKIKEKIETYNEICVYQEIESIDGMEFGAIIEKIKFLYEYGISNIKKIAVITDKRWMHNAVDIEDQIFKSIEMQAFSFEDKDIAVEFLKRD
jgi:SpoIIAA-like